MEVRLRTKEGHDGDGTPERERQQEFGCDRGIAEVAGPRLLREAQRGSGRGGLRRFVEDRCAAVLRREMGRPGIPPGVYFRMVFVGYFEGIDSQRGIAWRCSDSLSLERFLGLALHETSPDHSSMTRTRKRLPLEVIGEVFRFVLAMAEEHKL